MSETNKDERTWAMITHLSAFAYYFTGIGHIVGPLIVWMIKRKELPFVDDQGKEALNFQISITIYGLVLGLMILTVIFAIIAVPLLIALHVFQIIFIIVAAVKAQDGVAYRYPLCMRFIK